ncbi:tetratricopeptide repeat-containing glycosyltransferase family 2 protein [Selenomonas ruminis]|uniref:Glycosyltransferase n=1 Tax=Selenomonas ruminis TaxID=2593411 RepID=A0A5D6WAZ3_9FIRM|nr:glycosyltransferase family 2 protein [Selenomonas sp. mPRGC5]TYZ24159.1 glycosyltransferase [Selenomonas sp. mPRGC5]
MIKISACVIVKNEEKNIERWLKNVKKYSDEIIVVDTGSTDRTVEIVKKSKVKLYFFKWINDFSAAKNYAISKAKGNWIVFLDADEYFTPLACKRLRPYLESIHNDGMVMGIRSPLINIDEDNDNEILSTVEQVRIFRKDKTVFYVEPIHEYINCTKKRSYPFIISDLTIYHTGYSASVNRKKTERNLELLKLDIERAGGENEFHYPYLAVTYINMREFDKAIHYAELCIKNPNRKVRSQLGQMYHIILGSIRAKGGDLDEQQAIVDRELKDLPNHADAHWENGRLAFMRFDYVLALKEFDEALKWDEYAKDPRHFSEESVLDKSLYYLYELKAKIEMERGEIQQAILDYKISLQKYSYNARALVVLLNLLRDYPPVETIDFLKEIYDEEDEKEYKFLCDCLERSPRNEVYLYFVRPEPESYSALMAVGAYPQAANEAAKRLRSIYDMALQWYEPDNPRNVWQVLLPPEWKKKTSR